MSFPKRTDWMLVLFCLFAALILFTNLGSNYLWQDEAYTAVFSRNTLKFGTPRAFDGRNLLGNKYRDACMDKPCKYEAWFPLYLVAGSFWLFGESAFSARIPFALFGLGSAILCYLFAERLFKQRQISRLATALLVFSGPYFLYMRQCRWYALTTFFTLWALLSYIGLLEKRKFSVLGFVASGALLFNSNFGIFSPVLITLGVHFVVFGRKQLANNEIKKVLFYFLLIGIIILPSLFYHADAEFAGTLSLARTKGHIEFYFRVLNKYLFPCGVLFLSLTVFGIFRKKAFPIIGEPLNRSYLWLLIYLIIFTIGFLLFADERQLRYLIHLLPACSILMALLISGLLKVNRLVGTLVFAVVCFTNIFHTGAPFRKALWIPLVSIAEELTHDYDGPVEGIVKYLNQHARPEETVKIIYGDVAVIFYTRLKVDNGPFERETYPEWIIIRKDWFPFGDLDSRYRRRIESRYEKITLDYPDIMWENRPDPGYHKFRTVTTAPGVVIYRKKDGSPKKSL